MDVFREAEGLKVTWKVAPLLWSCPQGNRTSENLVLGR